MVQTLILEHNKVHVKISNVALKCGNLKFSKLVTMNVLKEFRPTEKKKKMLQKRDRLKFKP